MPRPIALLLTALLLATLCSIARAGEPFTFACRADNDLFSILSRAGERHARFETPGEAVQRATPESVLLVLADGYPDRAPLVDAKFYETAKSKRLRLYVEYPAAAPAM